MTLQTIENLFIFKKRIITEKYGISFRTLRWLEHELIINHKYFSREDLMQTIDTRLTEEMVVIEEKLFNGNLYPKDSLNEITILFNGKEFTPIKYFFDSDRGLNVFEVVVAEELIKSPARDKWEEVVEMFLKEHEEVLEENKKIQEKFIQHAKKTSFYGKLIKTK